MHVHQRGRNNLCKGKSLVSVGLVLVHSLAALKCIRSVRSCNIRCISVVQGVVYVVKHSIFMSAGVNHIF